MRIHQLLLGAPTLGRPLLEQTDRVAVAVVEVADADSWYAVASAIEAARGGRSRLTETPAMIEA